MAERKRHSREERIFAILNRLHSGVEVRVKDIQEEFGVSQVQVRNDLDWLAKIVPLRRSHGKAEREVAFNPFAGTFVQAKRERCPAEKQLIAAYAVRFLVANGHQLLLDSGTQVEAFVKELVTSQRPGLRVISQAAGFELQFLNYSGDYVQLGGVLNSRAAAFLDSSTLSTGNYFEKSTEAFLSEFCLEKGNYTAIISGTAFSYERGLMVNSKEIIRYKHMIMNAASDIIILLDHSKFFERARETVTWCGIQSDDWLRHEKPAKIVVDMRWDDKGEAPAFQRLANHPAITPEPTSCREFRDVCVFRTSLKPQSL